MSFYRYEAFRAAGICYSCKGKSRPGKVLCQKCADEKSAKERLTRPKRVKPPPKWKTGTDKRSALRRNGLCPRCGRPAPKQRVMCLDCLALRRRQTAALERIRLERRKKDNRDYDGPDEYADTARPKDRVADEMHRMAVMLAAGKLPW